MLTVAICTYNRAESLADTLQHLCYLELSEDLDWELLLIDNNCTDNTAEVAKRFASRLPLRYIQETKQGLSHGRNRAIAEAKGDLLIFTDDDIRVSPGWLTAYHHAAMEYPDAEYFGGKITPFWPNGKPNWVRDVNMPLVGSGIFGNYDLGGRSRLYVPTDMHPFGGNFALRRNLFERLEGFRTDLGVCGNVPGRGEEAEYFMRARNSGGKGVYVPEALVLHRVDADTLTLKKLYQYGIQKGVASKRMHGTAVSSYSVLRKEFMFLVRGIYQLFKGRGDRFRQCVVNMGIQRGLGQR